MENRDRNLSGNTPFLVDAHCHVDLYENPTELVARTEENRAYTIAVTNAPSVFPYTARLTAHTKFVRAAVGLHPELVHSHASELPLLLEHLASTRYVGEIGLDYTTPDKGIRQKQREVLAQILGRCADYGDKVLTLHSRRAAGDVIAAVGVNFPGKAILHWFSGSKTDLGKAALGGFYFSVNPAMVRSEKGQGLISQMPEDRVVTETDGPFVSIGSRLAVPWDSRLTVVALARIWRVNPDEAQERIAANFRQLLS